MYVRHVEIQHGDFLVDSKGVCCPGFVVDLCCRCRAPRSRILAAMTGVVVSR